MMKNKYLKFVFCLFLSLLWQSSILGQSEERVGELYGPVIDALEQHDWARLDKHCTQLIKEVKSPDFADLVSVVSYMHIHAISALMNERKISQKEAMKKVKVYKGKILIMPGHPFKEKCMFNCLYPTTEDVKVLHCTSSDEQGTLIYSFEYYEMDEALSESFLTENEGKVMKIRARLKEIEVSGQMLPRFGMRFDKVEFQIMEDAENENEEMVASEIKDSLVAHLKHGVFINALGSHFMKNKEFRDSKGDVVMVTYEKKWGGTKTTFGIEATSIVPGADLKEMAKDLDNVISDLNNKGGDENSELIGKVKKIDWLYFLGMAAESKGKNDGATSYLINGLWIKEGRSCKLFYIKTDTLGNKIDNEHELNNFKILLDKIITTDDPMKVAKSISKEHEALLKKMKIGIDKSKCNINDSDNKCLQIVVENTDSFTLLDVTSEAFAKAEKHQEKGYVIPNTPGAKIKLIFSNGTEIVEHPFTIPILPE